MCNSEVISRKRLILDMFFLNPNVVDYETIQFNNVKLGEVTDFIVISDTFRVLSPL